MSRLLASAYATAPAKGSGRSGEVSAPETMDTLLMAALSRAVRSKTSRRVKGSSAVQPASSTNIASGTATQRMARWGSVANESAAFGFMDGVWVLEVGGAQAIPATTSSELSDSDSNHMIRKKEILVGICRFTSGSDTKMLLARNTPQVRPAIRNCFRGAS